MSKLFRDFEPVSSKAWKQKIQVDLKGADYNDTLIWQSLEGINVKPFYHSDSLESPASFPRKNTCWNIAQSIYAGDTTLANKKALDAQ